MLYQSSSTGRSACVLVLGLLRLSSYVSDRETLCNHTFGKRSTLVSLVVMPLQQDPYQPAHQVTLFGLGLGVLESARARASILPVMTRSSWVLPTLGRLLVTLVALYLPVPSLAMMSGTSLLLGWARTTDAALNPSCHTQCRRVRGMPRAIDATLLARRATRPLHKI